ncbi:protein of unknown function [Ruminococcaceae bacterium BL-6]|nr:protein of unknown function [Ruminococcaceae bacterium BL-6]
MPDYEKMYFYLASKIADAIEILSEAQRWGENEYIKGGPSMISLLDTEHPEDGKKHEKVCNR